MVLEARSSRSRCQQVWFLVSALIVVLDGYFLPRCPHDLLCPSGRAGDGGERGGGRRKERALSCKATGTVGLEPCTYDPLNLTSKYRRSAAHGFNICILGAQFSP